MKYCALLALIAMLSSTASGQYYYNDIVANKRLNDEYVSLVNSGFKRIVLESFEDDNTPSEGFFCEKAFNSDFSVSKMISKSYITGESELETYYKNGKVSGTRNETPHATNTTSYQYEGDLLHSVKTKTIAEGDSSGFEEERIFTYDSSGSPVEMKRFRNGRQISVVRFLLDEHGNVIEENPVSGTSDRKYYYYYNDQNQLTDVVHFNTVAQKLLPDLMFLYNEKDLPSQMISVDESGRNYFIWRYSYTSQGLPEIQKCYSKEKRLLGTIQFEYLK